MGDFDTDNLFLLWNVEAFLEYTKDMTPEEGSRLVVSVCQRACAGQWQALVEEYPFIDGAGFSRDD
jgi:hypothetical protein